MLIKYMKQSFYFVVIIAFITSIAFAQTHKGALKGSVIDDELNPLFGATIKIEKTAYGAISDKSGKFLIKAIPNGAYTALISMVGYETQKFPFTIRDDSPLEINIVLKQQPLHTAEVVVSASKRIQAVQDVPISVSVIDSRVIMEKGTTKLSDALLYTPGVEVNKDNVSVRGSSGYSYGFGSRMALLLDGYPMLSGDSGEMKLDALPMFNVERIEVIKGAGSALYGTSALGGVINIITQEPQENAQVRFRAFSGIYTKPTFKQWEYSDRLHTNSGLDAGYSKRYENLAVRVSGGAYYNESYRAYDESTRWNLFSKLKYFFSDRTNASLTANFHSDKHDNLIFWNSLDSATFPPSDINVNEYIVSNKFSLFSEVNHIFTDKSFLIARAGAYLTSFYNNHQDGNMQSRASDALSNNIELQMNSKLSESIFMTYGANLTLNLVNSQLYGGSNHQTIASLYSQGEVNLSDNAIATAGLRLDFEKSKEAESRFELSPKFGLSYNLTDDISIRSSFGTGFRAPTVGERFATTPYSGFEVIPNPELKPESSISAEMGANYSFNFTSVIGQIDLAVFNSNMYDLIEPAFAPDLSGKIMFQNITKARITGAELSAKAFLLGAIGVESALTILNPKDLTLDETLKYRSKVMWYSRLTIPMGNFELQADYRYKDRFENLDQMLRIIQDYDARVDMRTVDVRFIAKLKKLTTIPVKATLNVSNAFNYYYTEMVGNLAPTRLVSLQLESDF